MGGCGDDGGGSFSAARFARRPKSMEFFVFPLLLAKEYPKFPAARFARRDIWLQGKAESEGGGFPFHFVDLGFWTRN